MSDSEDASRRAGVRPFLEGKESIDEQDRHDGRLGQYWDALDCDTRRHGLPVV